MKFLVVCDYRENFINYALADEEKEYNDHPSRENIEEIISAIKMLGHECEYFGGIPELIYAIDNHLTFHDCAFLNFTDGMDENYSRVQAPALLDILKVPYSGSAVFPSALMNNKHFCKQALKSHSITMPKSCIVNSNCPLNIRVFTNWKFPLFVKPNCEGSSLGISHRSVCFDINELKIVVSELLAAFQELIIEEYAYGLDVTNYLIGNNNYYPINDIVSAKLFDTSEYAVYGMEEKKNKLRDLYYNNEYLPDNIVKTIQEQSIEIANIIGVRDICRIDYRVNLSTQEINFIEINSAPRFSKTSEIGFIACKRGISFPEMLQYYIEAFLKRLNHSL